MAEPFLSEIRIMSFGFPPKGWATCDGQLMPINQNQALFSLLGTIYGGDGRVTFGLPNLQGRVPVHAGNGHVLAERGGEDFHTLVPGEMPMHTHSVPALTGLATRSDVTAGVLTAVPTAAFGNAYGAPDHLTPTAIPDSVPGPTGGGQAHENRQPYLALTFCIALQGIYP